MEYFFDKMKLILELALYLQPTAAAEAISSRGARGQRQSAEAISSRGQKQSVEAISRRNQQKQSAVASAGLHGPLSTGEDPPSPACRILQEGSGDRGRQRRLGLPQG
uniref:Uncharacterized protein n=1 Tax=Triticum urartu TaxID=4572 RepID=A0A8R7UDK2_TRIUA